MSIFERINVTHIRDLGWRAAASDRDLDRVRHDVQAIRDHGEPFTSPTDQLG